MKQVVVYPGRFQPMLPHHAAVFTGLQNSFPNAEVYIATSDKVEHPKSPFNFAEKKAIMIEMYNIPSDKIVNVKRPYNGDDYAQHFDAENTQLILIVGDKDMQTDARFDFNNVDPDTGIDMKLNGSGPKWMQMINSIKDGEPLPFNRRGYLATAPTVERNGEIASASAFRNAFVNAVDMEHRKEVMRHYLGSFDQGIFNLLQDKILDNKMSEDINRIKHLAGIDEAPVNFDDYQTVSPKDAKAAAERPDKAKASDPTKAEFFPADPKMFHSTIKKSIANRVGPQEDPNDPQVKKDHFMMELLKSPGLLLGEINARLKNDDNGLAVSDRLSAIISSLDEVGSVMNLPEDDKKFVIQIVSNALKNMDLVKDPKADQERAEYEKENESVDEDYADDCPECNGLGFMPDEPEKTCPKCDGEGIDDGYFGGTKEYESVDLSDVRQDYGIEEQVISEREWDWKHYDKQAGYDANFSLWSQEAQAERSAYGDKPFSSAEEMHRIFADQMKSNGIDVMQQKQLSQKLKASEREAERQKYRDMKLSDFSGRRSEMTELRKLAGLPEEVEPDMSEIKCPNCDQEHPVSAKACPHCGTPNHVAEGKMKDQAQEDFDILAGMKEEGASEEEIESKASELMFGMDVLHAVLNDWEGPFDDPNDEQEPDMEEAAKPDYIDIDGDGDKEEPMKKAAKDKKKKDESFDVDAEQSREEEAYNELMDAYAQGGEEAYAEACGLSMEELDQEMTEISMDLNLHMDDDRDEILQRHAETTVDNADWKDHGEQDYDMEEALDGTVDNAIEEAMYELRKLAGIQ